MTEQQYILKKYVRAESASTALSQDANTPVAEVFLVADKPADNNTHAVGFVQSPPDSGIPYEAKRVRGNQ